MIPSGDTLIEGWQQVILKDMRGFYKKSGHLKPNEIPADFANNKIRFCTKQIALSPFYFAGT